MTNEFLLEDRLTKIRSVINKYGEENFYISFSGGKDSTVLHYLTDQALPNNKIPRVYTNTGIDYNDIVSFVKEFAALDSRFIIIQPTRNIKDMLETVGYPFKSKLHSAVVDRFQRLGKSRSVKQYLGENEDKEKWSSLHTCPNILRYQFTEGGLSFPVSNKCCDELKKKPMAAYKKAFNKKYNINGIRAAEEGNRFNAKCLAFRGNKLTSFQPLVPLSDEFMNWYIDRYHIRLCKLYYPPYNFKRTGCKGCPFASGLQNVLDILKEKLPNEYRQCEIIWKPVYDEYRRLGYRLKAGEDNVND